MNNMLNISGQSNRNSESLSVDQIKTKNDIQNSLINIKLPEGFNLTFPENWTFPDNHVYNTQKNESMICLNYNKKPIGLLDFIIDKANNNQGTIKNPTTIRINFIQGIKSNDPREKFPKKWPEIIIDIFFISVLETHPSKFPTIRYDQIPKTKKTLEILKQMGYTGNITEFAYKIYPQLVSADLMPHTMSEEKMCEHLKNLELINQFIRKIQERYFLDSGYLNFKKKRVAEPFNQRFQELRKKQKTEQKPLTRKKLRPISIRK